MPLPLTKAEKQAIDDLRALARRWPKTLWIYAAGSVHLHIMKCGDNGEPVVRMDGSPDPGYLVGEAAIPNDGGDW